MLHGLIGWRQFELGFVDYDRMFHRPGLFQHPSHRKIGEAALIPGIASSDIGMHPWEPYLLETPRQVIFFASFPQLRFESFPVLVDRKHVARVLDGGIEGAAGSLPCV